MDGGGIGNLLAKGILKKAGTGAVAQLLARGTQVGTTLGTLGAGREATAQAAGKEFQPGSILSGGVSGFGIGAAGGAPGAIGGKVLGTALETAGFAQASALLEHGRLANAQDYIESAAVIGPLKAVGSVKIHRRLGAAMFKKSKGQEVTAEEQQVLDQTPDTIKERIALDVKKKTEPTQDIDFTKENLVTTEGAREFLRRHHAEAKAISDAPDASQKNFGPLKQVVPEAVKLNRAEREQFRALVKEAMGEEVLRTEPKPDDAVSEGFIKEGEPPPNGGGTPPKSGLVVANIGADGKIYYGRAGDLHSHLSERYGESIRKSEGLKPGEETFKGIGFSGPNGKFLTREEALAKVDVKPSKNMEGELDAGDLRDQVPPPAPTSSTAPATRLGKVLPIEPLAEPGPKLDKIQETVVENARKAATPETPPEALPIVPLDNVLRSQSRGMDAAKRFGRFLETGGAHKDVVTATNQGKAFVRAHLRELKFMLDDFYRGRKEIVGKLRSAIAPRAAAKRLPAHVTEAINNFMVKKGTLDDVPEPMQPALRRIRDTVDALSRRYIEDGVIQGDMVATFTDNMGTYMHLDHKIFQTNPQKIKGFIKRLGPAKVNRAIAFLRQGWEETVGRKLTPQEETAYLESFLHKAAEKGNFIGAIDTGAIGTRASSILKHRGNVPQEIRDIYDPVTDPDVQLARTYSLMAQHMANIKVQQGIIEAGLSKWLFTEPQGEFVAGIEARPGTPLYPHFAKDPRSGGLPFKYYTTPDLKAGLDKHFAPNPMGNLVVRGYFMLNAAVKGNKTAGSVRGIMRNLLWNWPIAIANAHLDPTRPIETLQSLRKAIGLTAVDLDIPVISRWLRLPIREQQAELKKLIELEVVNSSSMAGELRENYKDFMESGTAENFIEGRFKKFGRFLLKGGTPQKMFDAFMSGDDVWHSLGYYMERAAKAKQRPNATAKELDVEAASIIRAVTPTYSQAAKVVQVFRKAIFFGDFVTWPAEVYRTTKNQLALTVKEMNDPNPLVRNNGIKRGIGLAAVGAMVTGVGPATRMITGISKEEEEALRKLSPEWMQNSAWVFVGKPERLKYRTIDTQYSLPQSFMYSPIIAAMRGDDVGEAGKMALSELLRPFFNRTILSEVVGDLWANQEVSKGSSKVIVNPELPAIDQTIAIEEFLRKRMQPGTINDLNKIWKALWKQELPSGRIPDLGVEVTATLLGFRLVTHDVPLQFGWMMRRQLERRKNARRIFFTAAFASGGRNAPEIQDAFDKAVNAEREIFKTMQEFVGAAKVPGMTEAEIRKAMDVKRVAVPKGLAERIISGNFDEDSLLRSTVWSLSEKEFDERVPRILQALGVSQEEARRLLIAELAERGTKTLRFPTKLRFKRVTERLLDGG